MEHGKYLGSSGDGKLIVSGPAQCWTIGSSPHGGIFIQSIEHGWKLECNDDGHIFTTEVSGGWETWRLEPIMPHTISGKNIWMWSGMGVQRLPLPSQRLLR